MKKLTPNSGFLNLLQRLWNHLSTRRKKQFFFLAILMFVSALVEVFSLGALLPFIGILTAPETVFKHKVIAQLALNFGFTEPSQLVFPLTITFISAALGSGAVRLLLLRISTNLAYSCGSDLSSDVYRRTLYQPYRVHVGRNSSTIISGITVKVTLAVNVLYQLLTLMSSLILLIAIGGTLIVINPLVALVASVGFGFCYLVISLFSRKKLQSYSKVIAYEQTQAIKALQEGLGGIRDVLLDSTQAVFCEIYKKADRPLRQAKGDIIYLSGKPRFVMEAAGMVLIAILAYYLSLKPGGISTALPILAALALGAQRMLPAFQQAYSAWSSILGDEASLSDTIDLLDQPLDEKLLLPLPEPLDFKESLRFKEVSFRYASEGLLVLNKLDFTIPKGARVGVVGITGSGKSTALDLLMGLLPPDEGEILIDGQPLTGSRVRAWQRTIAHVPQAIYLSDATVAANIAFGVPSDQINLERVKLAARQAQIAATIEKNPLGYDAFVGERGVRLSGGQRQRIGIARALYKQASVLILDEATSALDNSTEKSVMEAIDGLHRDLTVIIIAHRLTTVRNCDFILELEHGKVKHYGTYDELVEQSPSFRKMSLGDREQH